VNSVGRALRAFGMFWFNFLIGDTPEVFVGVLVVIGGALLLRHDRAVAFAYVIGLVVVVLATSVYRGRNNAQS
jgi:undecaprenyl pyrophosphate phosphatase UppP